MSRFVNLFSSLALGALCAWTPATLAAQASVPTASGAALSGAIRPGDVIRLKVWREPDFSGDYAADETGMAVFPRLGPMRVTDYTVDSLKQTLVHRYAAYLVNPSIEVTALRRIKVLGSVRTPGLYQVDPTMTVADAIALAGGVSPDGRGDRVDLLREGQRLTANLEARTRLGDTPISSGDQLYVPQRSWLSRNTAVIAAGITAVAVVGASAFK